MTGLDRGYRIVGSRYFNHFPEGGRPSRCPGVHPLDLQPLCQEKPGNLCAAGHRKHHLQRWDRSGPAITSGLGFHAARADVTLVEPPASTFTHHFPYRLEAGDAGPVRRPVRAGRVGARPGSTPTTARSVQRRHDVGHVEAVPDPRPRVRGRVGRGREPAARGGAIGVEPEPWTSLVDPADAVSARWYTRATSTPRWRPGGPRPAVVNERSERAGRPPLPNFVIVGAMRSGSTSLYKYLQVHPQVWMPRKEIHFFDRRWDNGLDWYRERFDGWSGQPAVGEATPTYLAETEALDRMAATIPDAKLVAILRDPVDRAYSHYWMEHVRGRDDRPFADAADARRTTWSGAGTCPSWRRRAPGSAGTTSRWSCSTTCGRRRATRTRRCAAFLGVDPAFRPRRLGERVNRFVSFRSMRVRDARRRLPKALRIGRIVGKLNAVEGEYPPLDPALAARLRADMAADNAALAAWLGRDLSAWA